MSSINGFMFGILTLGIFKCVLGTSAVAALTQEQTNGRSWSDSIWGTLEAPKLPPFLTNIRYHPEDPGAISLLLEVITRKLIAPDGYQKNGIVINGQFPGPLIEANWGDTIEVTVNNQITGPEEGTSLHWHGLLQKDTPWFDGVPAVQQCPIAPESSFTYTSKADLYGTSWYHSHYSAQYADGAFGPIVIYGPEHGPAFDVDLGPVLSTDWYHSGYFEVLEILFTLLAENGDPAPRSDNNLINGKMNFDCSTFPPNDKTPCTDNAGYSKFHFVSGNTYKLRLINAGAEPLQFFSIDGHNLTIVANDFVPIVPYTTNTVTLGVGQRSDVLVTVNQRAAGNAFWMRTNIALICSSTNQPQALAAIYYDDADTNVASTSTAWGVPDPGTCENDDLSLTEALYPIAPTLTPATTKNLTITFFFNETGSFLYKVDNSSFRAGYNLPVLLLANQGNFSYEPEWNVYNFGSNTSIRINLYNPTLAAHPMHLHGHNMYILHQGFGEWDGVSITRPGNPQRRDTHQIAVVGHMVFQIDADNPGVWPFHCHIAWHVSGGLYVNILERPTDIGKDKPIPLILAETCRNWWAYTNHTIVDQIDSGL